jgi:hypothetical protein
MELQGEARPSVIFINGRLRIGGKRARAVHSRGARMRAYLFSCEHAVCTVPEAQRDLFRGAEEEVSSGEGWEPGALNLAQGFAMKFRTPLVHGEVTRLLIDLEQDGEARWSRFTGALPEVTRGRLADRLALPYRAELKKRIAEDLRRHEVLLHVLVHTDAERTGVVTLETPPGAAVAEKLARGWRARLVAAGLDVRQVAEVELSALARDLAGDFPVERYAQVRLGVSQSFFLEGQPWRWAELKKVLVETLA